ncbi:phosphatase PAP2 family protein [Saccharopolyspora subtropica]|uniref:Phosphatase PAP2 family protein n=1 Tax=Saccharopolyspora thermophila TaxID=89367 RepID=A0A917K0Q3_9PSEU|nr:phosphatase PAP2 family protein [Saccharopolyspora subtropica]GGI92423.1 phosphatase PAP2 family protein [Saccharopolyspora subtropica]
MSLSLTSNEIEDVPDVSIDWYRAVTGLAAESPEWVQAVAVVATDAVLLVLGALVVANLWRIRRADLRARVLAWAAPVVTVVAYVLSETTKSLVEQERPCRAVRGAAASVAECPEPGDWSFPSNHSTIAAAVAVALAVAWRRLAVVVLVLAPLEAFLRVFLGVHYPHDVITGLLLGSVTAAVGMVFAAALVRAKAPAAAQHA